MCCSLFIFSMVVLYFANGANYRMDNIDAENDKYTEANLYDNTALKDIANKIDMLSTAHDDLHSKFDKNNKRLEEDLMSLKTSLEHIKQVLEGSTQHRMPENRERKERQLDQLSPNNVADELSRMIKKLIDAQHSDLQDVKDAVRNETSELQDQFRKQNRLLTELQTKLHKLDQQLKSDAKVDQNYKIDNLGDEVNKMQDVGNVLRNATIELQDKLHTQNQILTELKEQFNRMDVQQQSEKPRERPPAGYRRDNNIENNNSSRKKLTKDQCNCQQDFQKLKRELQTEFQKHSDQLSELQEKTNQVDQQISERLERESYMVKNKMDGEFQKQSHLLVELQGKLNREGQQIKTKVEAESRTLKNAMQEELQNLNHLLLEMQKKSNVNAKELFTRLDMDSKRIDNLKIELSANMKDIKDSLKDELQKEFQQHNRRLLDLQAKLNEMMQQIKNELHTSATYTISTLIEMKDDILAQGSSNLAEIKVVFQNEMHTEFQKQSRLLSELKEKFEQQIARDLEKERIFVEQLNKMKNTLLMEHQNDLRSVMNALENEFQNDFEKQNSRFAELKATLNKVDQETNKIGNFTQTFSKIKDEILADQRKNLEDVKDMVRDVLSSTEELNINDQLNKMRRELLSEQQKELRNVKDVQVKELRAHSQKEADLLSTLQMNNDQLKEDMANMLKLQNRLNGSFTEQLNALMKVLKADQQDVKQKINILQENVLKNQANEQKALRDAIQHEFQKENHLIAELKSMVNIMDPETHRISNLGEELSKMKEELLTDQCKNLENIKDILRNTSADFREELQKQLQINYDQPSEDVENVFKMESHETDNVTDDLGVIMKEIRSDQQDMKLILNNQTNKQQDLKADLEKLRIDQQTMKVSVGNLNEELEELNHLISPILARMNESQPIQNQVEIESRPLKSTMQDELQYRNGNETQTQNVEDVKNDSLTMDVAKRNGNESQIVEDMKNDSLTMDVVERNGNETQIVEDMKNDSLTMDVVERNGNETQIVEDMKNDLSTIDAAERNRELLELQTSLKQMENELRDFQSTISANLQKINSALLLIGEQQNRTKRFSKLKLA